MDFPILCMAAFISTLLSASLLIPDRGRRPWHSLGTAGLLFNFVAGLSVLTVHLEATRPHDWLHWLATFDGGMGFACILAGVRRRRETLQR